MTAAEAKAVVRQLMFVYSANRRAPRPFDEIIMAGVPRPGTEDEGGEQAGAMESDRALSRALHAHHAKIGGACSGFEAQRWPCRWQCRWPCTARAVAAWACAWDVRASPGPWPGVDTDDSRAGGFACNNVQADPLIDALDGIRSRAEARASVRARAMARMRALWRCTSQQKPITI